MLYDYFSLIILITNSEFLPAACQHVQGKWRGWIFEKHVVQKWFSRFVYLWTISALVTNHIIGELQKDKNLSLLFHCQICHVPALQRVSHNRPQGNKPVRRYSLCMIRQRSFEWLKRKPQRRTSDSCSWKLCHYYSLTCMYRRYIPVAIFFSRR